MGSLSAKYWLIRERQIMPCSMLRRLGHSSTDLIKTNVTLNDFSGQASGTQGVLNVDLTVGRKIIPTSFFIVNSKSTYAVLLGRDWIHANCCIPSTMHQCLIQWDGDEVEVVQADDALEDSTLDKADPRDRPQKMKSSELTSSEPKSCKLLASRATKKGTGSSNRSEVASSCGSPVCNIDLTGDDELGYGFISADELEETDIGPRDEPRPIFISKTKG